jgi:hypothetical protein
MAGLAIFMFKFPSLLKFDELRTRRKGGRHPMKTKPLTHLKIKAMHSSTTSATERNN